jgi:hypothetical protein
MTKKKDAKPQPVRPSLLNPSYKYVPANETNVMNTWKRFGYVPPSEVKNVQAA